MALFQLGVLSGHLKEQNSYILIKFGAPGGHAAVQPLDLSSQSGVNAGQTSQAIYEVF